MHNDVQRALSAARITVDDFPCIAIRIDEQGRPLPIGDTVRVVSHGGSVDVSPKPISSLWIGAAKPPDFARGPPPAYAAFFLMIETAARDFCTAGDRPETDAELERLYNHLRRRPDGHDANPLFAYLQAAAAIYMSMRNRPDASTRAPEAETTSNARSACCRNERRALPR